MSQPNKIQQFLANERSNWKKMPKKDRGWYIWNYYRIPILGILMFVCMLALFLSAALDNTQAAMQTVVINNVSAEALNDEPLTTAFHSHMGFAKNQAVTVQKVSIPYYADMGIFDQVALPTLHAWISAQQVDLVFSNDRMIQHLNEIEVLKNLELLLPADLWERVKPLAVYTKDVQTGQEIPTALDISDTAFALESKIQMEPALICVISNTKNAGNCIAMIQYIMDYE